MSKKLEWPLESVKQDDDLNRWFHAESNLCLDFHGDPIRANLTVFSDGNHHMALEACLKVFCENEDGLEDIFYATTPPAVISSILKKGHIVLGNLTLSKLPDVFISPPDIMDKLVGDGWIDSHKKFIKSNGNVLLVRKENPKCIQNIEDLLREDIRLFISNPVTEKASHEVYKKTLLRFATKYSINTLFETLEKNIVYGERIHHREAPQCLYDDRADVAIVYYHLALRYMRIFPDVFDIIYLEGTQHNFELTKEKVCTDYHIGLLNNNNNTGGRIWAEKFLNYMFSVEATSVYIDHGLQRP